MKIREPVRVLSPDEMQMIHENALRIFEEVDGRGLRPPLLDGAWGTSGVS